MSIFFAVGEWFAHDGLSNKMAQVYLNNKDIKKISLKASTIQPHELLPLKLRF